LLYVYALADHAGDDALTPAAILSSFQVFFLFKGVQRGYFSFCFVMNATNYTVPETSGASVRFVIAQNPWLRPGSANGTRLDLIKQMSRYT
jgi:hypothetical protein